MGLEVIPDHLKSKFRFDERHHACSILDTDFSLELQDICDCLDAFWLRRSAILTPGGGRSPISREIDDFFQIQRGWSKKRFDIRMTVDSEEVILPSHEIDNFKNRIGIEVEWNNKTEFYDRDLNNFRLLWERRVLSVGVIITRVSELQGLFDELGKGKSYGPSTTHWDKLMPKIEAGGSGGRPLLIVGMGFNCYRSNE